MTVWVRHFPLSKEEEQTIKERAYLPLPFEGLPDLSHVPGPAQAIEMLAMLHPDEPPESINNRLDRFWPLFEKIHFEDVIAVPLPVRRQVVLAEVRGGYHYRVGENGEDIHEIPVKFYELNIPMSKLKKHQEWFTGGGNRLLEITDTQARVALRSYLPHSYNRFARFKWLLVVFFLMSLVRMVAQFHN